jgi:formylglycine-generating enzyme required for sulfatase activity
VAVDNYDIDANEVTRADYKAFLAAQVDPQTQPSYCHWNAGFAVTENDTGAGCDKPFDPETFPDRPAVCINWCDAVAYCAWSGRRLCGRIGGGSLQDAESDDPTRSQWHRACTKGGTQLYPYGDTFNPGNCNAGGSNHGGVPIETGSLPDCVGGYPGLFDMSGNVEEWEDSCNTGIDPNDPADDGCALRGGAFWTDATESQCNSLKYYAHRNVVSNDWGFRCCSK